MPTLYDFPLEYLESVPVQKILSNSKTINGIIAGYDTWISRLNPNAPEVQELVKMMKFFESIGLCKLLSVVKLKYADGSDALSFKSVAGFSNFPLDSFIGQVRSYTSTKPASGDKSENPSVSNSAVFKKGAVLNKAEETVVSTPLVVPPVQVSSAEDSSTQLYFAYHKATTMFEKDLLIAQKLLFLKSSASRRGLAMELTFKDLKNLYKRKTCAYTGVAFDESNSDAIPTVERKDPNVGYLPTNVLLCTNWANNFKCEVLENPCSKVKTDLKTLIRFTTALQKYECKDKIIVPKEGN